MGNDITSTLTLEAKKRSAFLALRSCSGSQERRPDLLKKKTIPNCNTDTERKAHGGRGVTTTVNTSSLKSHKLQKVGRRCVAVGRVLNGSCCRTTRVMKYSLWPLRMLVVLSPVCGLLCGLLCSWHMRAPAPLAAELSVSRRDPRAPTG